MSDAHLCRRRHEGGCSKPKNGHAYPQRLCHANADGTESWFCRAHYPTPVVAT